MIFNIILVVFLILSGCNNSKPFDISNDEVFVEVFHALEIYKRNTFNQNEVQYIDYIIQKHGLWKRENLKSYKRAKDELSLNSDKQNRLFLAAQDYEININWQREYKGIESDSKEDFLNYLKIENNDLYMLISDLLSDDKQIAKKAYKKIYDIEIINWDTKNNILVNNALRKMFRDIFEKEFLRYTS